MSSPGSKAVARMRTKMLRAAGGFKDYNFRNYFVKHVEEDFAKVDPAQLAEKAHVDAFVKEKTSELRQMQRMALTNAMYSHQKVFLDNETPNRIVPKKSKAGKLSSA